MTTTYIRPVDGRIVPFLLPEPVVESTPPSGGSGAKYWRLRGFTVTGAFLEVSEIQLFASSVLQYGTLTSSDTPAGNPVSSLNDESLSTRCYWSSSTVANTGFWIQMSYGSPVSIDGIKLGGFDTANRYPAGFEVQKSLDNITWITVTTFTGLAYPGNNTLSALLPVTDPAAEASGGGDPDYDKVVLLLHMDGENNSTVFTDSSTSALTPSSRTAVVTTSESVFGGASGDFTSGKSLTYAPSSLFTFPGDFCIESWVTKPSGGKAIFEIGSLNGILFRCGFGDDVYVNGSSLGVGLDSVIAQGEPTHVVICRSGTTLRVFTRGRVRYSGTFTGTINPTGAGLKIGTAGYTSGENWNGCIDEFRITKGAARYTANFLPPVTPFPNS